MYEMGNVLVATKTKNISSKNCTPSNNYTKISIHIVKMLFFPIQLAFSII